MILPSLTILLLDDEPMLRRATAMLLAGRGGRVTAAASADEAVALSGARVYDVGILDLSPPGPSAPDVLRRMKEGGVAPRRVIAVCSAPLDRGDAGEFTVVLHKPYVFERLVAAVFGRARRAPPPPLSRSGPRRAHARARRGPFARVLARRLAGAVGARWGARARLVRRPRRGARAGDGRG
jgi:DNA-binding response OmpR family regulator